MNDFVEAVRPVAEWLRDRSLAEPAQLEAQLRDALPLDGPVVRELVAVAERGLEEGWLVPKEAGGVRFGRATKDCAGFSVDVVLSTGAGPRHRHPHGEVDLLLGRDGEPRFDGREPGWAVYAPGSEHVPAVAGGTMLIVYLLPGGAIEWC